uniref:Mitochondrial substrate carrier family protein n=1 Tax=Solanum tuberosum TaxID=4113 RepID=M1C996_SOLTU
MEFAKTVVAPLESVGLSVIFVHPYQHQILLLITHTVPGIGKGPILDVIAGLFAAGTAVLYAYPLDLVRAQLAYQFVGSKKLNMQWLATGEQFYKGVRDCFSKTYMEAGIRGLLLWSCNVSQENRKSIRVKLVCGTVAGLLGQTFSYPLYVVRQQMQVVPYVAIGFTVYDVMKSYLTESIITR